MDNLFNENSKKLAPLADRLRPKDLDDFLGQEHIVGKNSLLRRAIASDKLGSCIFFGPPGTGKTTLASIIAKQTGSLFVMLNAVSSGVADVKKVIADAKSNIELYGKKTYLLLDECHRWNKAQSDSMLEAIEKGYIVFIGATTENPFVSMTRAIVSRCRVFEFKPLSKQNILSAINKALSDTENGFGNLEIEITKEAKEHFARTSGGDARVALGNLEIAVISSEKVDGVIKIDEDIAKEICKHNNKSIDLTPKMETVTLLLYICQFRTMFTRHETTPGMNASLKRHRAHFTIVFVGITHVIIILYPRITIVPVLRRPS